VLVAVAPVHPADQLLADLAREVEINVGHRSEGLVQEPAEKEPGGDRVHMREAQEITHDGRNRGAAPAPRQQAAVGATAPPPHVGRDLAGQLEQVVIDEKEPAQPMPLDERQLGREPALGLVAVRGAGGVTLLEARPAQLGEGLRGRRAVGAVKVGKPVAEIPREIERPTALRQHQRGGDSFRTVTKQLRDLARRPQEKLAIGTPDLVRAVEGGVVADRDQHVVQPVPRARVIVRVARRHDAETRVPRQLDQGAGEGQVAPHIVPL
jgi:hypothetical protein